MFRFATIVGVLSITNASLVVTRALADGLPADAVSSLQSFAKQFDDCEVAFIRKDAKGNRLVDGFLRSAEGQSQLEFTYDADPTVVCVARTSAFFRLERATDDLSKWIPRRLSPTASFTRLSANGKLNGPDEFLQSFAVMGHSIWDVAQASWAGEDWKTRESVRLENNRWRIVIENTENAARECAILLDIAEGCRCIQVMTKHSKGESTTNLEYDNSSSKRLSRLVRSENGEPFDTVEYNWISSKSAPQNFFLLSNYGLSERLLSPIDPSPTSNWMMYGIGVLSFGVLILLFAVVFGRKRGVT